MNSRLSIFLLLLLLLPLHPVARSDEPLPAMSAPRQNFQYPPRQTLTYSVDWRVFTAGKAVFHLEQEGDRQRITGTATSIGTVNMLFHVSDRFQSVLDRKTGCSYLFTKQTLEGRRQVNSTLLMNYGQHKSMYDEKNIVKNTTKQLENPIPACVSDLLSAVFYTASQPLEIGRDIQFPLADATKTVRVVMKVEKREEVKTPLGTFQTIRVQPTADVGIVRNRGNIWIWYTDDERHLPVQMRARLLFGTLTLKLTGNEQQ